jgi:hypothetical protein
MLPIHRHILKDAWNITIKARYLWLLGFFAALLGNGSEFQMLTGQLNMIKNQNILITALKNALLRPSSDLYKSASNWSFDQTILALLILAIVFVLIWLTVASVGGLVFGINKKNNNQATTIGQLLRVGNKNWWSTFIYLAIAKGVTSIVIVLIFAPIMAATFQAGYWLLNALLVFICILLVVPLSIIINFITKFAIAAKIINNLDFKTAWLQALKLFQKNWLIVIEQALILLAINLVIGFLLIIEFIILFGPFFLLGSASYGGFFPLVVMGLVINGLIIIFIGSLLACYQFSAWTLLYLRLNSNQMFLPKLVRFINSLPNKFSKNS